MKSKKTTPNKKAKPQSSKAAKKVTKKAMPAVNKIPRQPAKKTDTKKLQSSKAGTVSKAKIEVVKPSTSKVVAKKAPNLATKLGLFDNCVKRNGRIFLKPPTDFADFPDLLSLQKK